jgi:CheY-like chemotaxis protein
LFWFELPLQFTSDSETVGPVAAVELTPSQPTITTSPDQVFEAMAPSDVLRSTPARHVKHPTRQLLLVEDNKINQKLALVLLQRLGYSVDIAENGHEAVAAASKLPYALIFMDMQMPEMDGIEATRQIRSGAGPNKNSPIVALTANAMLSDQQACRLAGMNDYLSKPFSQQELAASLARWLEALPS